MRDLRRGARPTSTGDVAVGEVPLRFPAWLNPFWIFLAIPVLTAIGSVALPESAFMTWLVPKYLGLPESMLLLLGLSAVGIGIMIGLRQWPPRSSNVITIGAEQLVWVRRAYTGCLWLTIFGYTTWFFIGFHGGVGLSDLASVLRRDASALGHVKDQSRPIGGLTTWTQLGPIAVALGVLLRRLGVRTRGVFVVVALSAVRTIFYAERLALLETAIPALVVLALTSAPGDNLARYSRAAPLVMPPALWSLFAASEYSRSWVHYQNITSLPFAEWVTLRMFGYYTTAYNNSALLFNALPPASPTYFSIDAFWNAPGVGWLFQLGPIGNLAAEDWWLYTLRQGANMEFTNPGSILVVFAEFGIPLGVLAWIAWGFIYGRIYRRATSASIPALIAYSVLLVGVLELPRFNYLTLGRCTPTLLALLAIALTYPKSRTA